ncbi:MAG: PQQ-binding-like beta-propeller repeat protein [Nitrososphaerales archaeon]
MYQNNPQHTSLSTNNGPSNPQTEWVYGPIGPVVSSPVIGSDGTVYFVSDNNRLYAINSYGSYSWSVKIGEASSTPAIGSNGVIFVPTTQHVFAYETNGILLWNVSVSPSTSPSPLTLGPSGTLYLVSNQTLYEIMPSGQIAWSVQTQCGGSAVALGQDGTIYCGGAKNLIGDNLFAYSPTGQLQWSFNAGTSSINLSPTVGPDGAIYVITSGGLLDAVSPSGTLLWQNTTLHHAQTPLAIGPDGSLYAAGTNLMSFFPDNPTLRWELSCYTPPGGTTCIQFGVVTGLAVDSSGNLYVEDTTTIGSSLLAFTSAGTLIWDYSGFGSTDRLQSSPAIASNGAIYLGTACFTCSQAPFGKLYAIGLNQGQFPITVTESGLPNSTSWSFFLNGENYTTSSNALLLSGFSGSYPWNAPGIGYNSTLGTRYDATVPNGTMSVEAPVSLSINFLKQFQVSVLTDPLNVASASPGGTEWYFPAATIVLNAGTSSEYPFYSWTTSNPSQINITNDSETFATARVNGSGQIVAVYYSPITIIAAEGGSVKYVAPPSSGTLQSQNSTITIDVPAGTNVAVSAQPDNGFSFVGWSSSSSTIFSANATSPTLSFKAGYALNLTARFVVGSPTVSSSIASTNASTSPGNLQTSATQTVTGNLVFPTTKAGSQTPPVLYVALAVLIILILIGATAAIAYRKEKEG